jgi:hypothetical protein
VRNSRFSFPYFVASGGQRRGREGLGVWLFWSECVGRDAVGVWGGGGLGREEARAECVSFVSSWLSPSNWSTPRWVGDGAIAGQPTRSRSAALYTCIYVYTYV